MNQSTHEKGAPNAKAAGRRKWTTPTITCITAGAAELNVGTTDEGVDLS